MAGTGDGAPQRRPHLTRRELVAGAACLAGAASAAAAALQQGFRHTPEETPNTMKPGLVTYNVAKDWPLETILKVCQESRMQAVEFRTTHAHGVEPSLGADRRSEIAKRCADAGLLQTSLGTVCEFHSPDPSVVRRNVDVCGDFVLLAKDIGARGVKVRPNGLPEGVEPRKTCEQIGKALAECGRIGADHGVEIWMEVHGGGTSLPANVRLIMDACGHPNAGITWNSNGSDVLDGSVRQAFDLLKPFIRCCHITDLWSAYPWRELFGLLRQARYDRFALCEVGTSMPPDAGAAFLRCYRALFEELAK